jgi:hypothetical protein
MKTTHAPLGVTRINSPKSRAVGWMARIQRGGVRRHEFFADKDCGGSRRAQAAAIRLVRKWRLQLPAAQTSHRGVLTKRNKSGEVNLYKRVQKTEEHEYEFWTGTWIERGGRKRLKSFSCHKYTERGARRLAQIARDVATPDFEKILAEYAQRHGSYPKSWKPE